MQLFMCMTRATSVPHLQKICECDFKFIYWFLSIISVALLTALLLIHNFLARIFHEKVQRYLYMTGSLICMPIFTVHVLFIDVI